MKEKRLVLNVSWYSFKDQQDSSKLIEGVKITSISLDNSNLSDGSNAVGIIILEDKARDLSVLENFSTVPAIYDFEYGIAVKKGKVELEFKKADFVEDFKFDFLKPAKKDIPKSL